MPKCFLKTVGDFRLRCQHTYRHITDIGINLFEYINDVIEKTITIYVGKDKQKSRNRQAISGFIMYSRNKSVNGENHLLPTSLCQ